MKAQGMARWGALMAVGALALTACGSDNATGTASGDSNSGKASVSGTLSGVGASSQQAAMTAWQSGFTSAASGAHVQYSPDGSGAGRKALLAGAADFAGSDAHLSPEEYNKSKDKCGAEGAIDIPVYISPIAVAFNLPGVKSLNLDGETLAKIFKGDIKNWNDEAIKAQNEGLDLPDLKITVVHRSDDSGTTENFTEYLAAASNGAWGKDPSGNWPGDYAAEANKGTSGVVSTTSSTQGAITYADASAIGDLGKAKIKIGDGSYAELSAATAAKTVENSQRKGGMNAHDMSLDLNRTPETADAYPIVLVSYHIVCSSYSSQEKADLVKAFGKYVVSEQGQKDAAEAASSAPLTAALTEEATKAYDSITVK